MYKHPRHEEMLDKIKHLIPNNDENPNYDYIVDYVLCKAIDDVANYCNIPVVDLPEELDNTIISMTMQLINSHGWLEPENSGNVTSLSEGDASVTFKSPAAIYQELQTINTISDNYVQILNNFRRLQL